MIEIIGWIGGIALSVCALPQAVQTYRSKDASGLNMTFLFLWFKGEVLTLAYIIANDMNTGGFQLPLYLNYSLNLLIVGYLFYAKKKY